MKGKFTYLFIVILIVFSGSLKNVLSQSVLSTGYWYKVAINKNGVYSLSYSDFEEMGFDVENLDPKKIQVFGNAEGQLPEANNIAVPHGLVENRIMVQGEEDGSFDSGDQVIFYAVGPNKWEYERIYDRFKYSEHSYDNFNYYYITLGEEDGKRLNHFTSLNTTPFKVVTDFLHKEVHEVNLVNFVKSGRKWFGESFDDYDTLDINFDFKHLNNNKIVEYGIYAAGRSSENSIIYMDIEGSELQEFQLPKKINAYRYAKEASLRDDFFTTSNQIRFKLTYSKPTPTSNAWLDYLEVSAYRYLVLDDEQLVFNFDVRYDENEVFEFKTENATDETSFWDISNPYNVKNIDGLTFDENGASFQMLLDDNHSFAIFNNNQLFSPQFIGSVENQNLKGLGAFKMAVITTEEFKEQAQRLIDFHESVDGIHSVLVTPQEIYNEFSSGKQDPSAIRNFMRYHYNLKPEEEKPEFLMLFGDASYDYKDVLPNNTNVVPVYQSLESTSLSETYNTDDYYGILGQLDGDSSLGEIQIAIGRFPVNNLEDAEVMVDKTLHYASNSFDVMGDWRNRVCFIADDEDSNLHFNDSNELADTFMVDHPEFNVDKLFLDSYVQETTANGDRYPDVTDAIAKKTEEGLLFVNYTGHGGHLSLTEERVIQIPDILSWKNRNKLSIWIVASCEFGPFDDPDHVSAGEHLILNPFGGGVALFTTTRLAYASYNAAFNKKFHEIAFSRNEEGAYFCLGEISKYAKNESGNLRRNLNFALLGDPALRMAYPKYHVTTTHINRIPVEQFNDTIKGRQTVHIKGEVTGFNNETLSNFNGDVLVKVYGKPSTYNTLGNDPKSYKVPFDIIDYLIFENQIDVNNGQFEFSFVVPNNIPSSFGNGKISYYAKSENGIEYTDANGGYIDFIIGGVDESITNDLEGPEIKIHLDSYNFENGGAVSTTPLLLVDLYDKDGINTINLGIGKEIKAVLDRTSSLFLNQHYKSTENSFQEGKIEYELDELDFGNHTIEIKAWDMFDNPSEKSVSFIVLSSENINIFNLLNSPNPFSEETYISFNHNQSKETDLKVRILIYDLQGKLSYNIEEQAIINGNSIEPISLKASDIITQSIRSGLYTYRVEIENSEGQKAFAQQKLLIVK